MAIPNVSKEDKQYERGFLRDRCKPWLSNEVFHILLGQGLKTFFFLLHIEHCEVSEVCVDEENKVVTSPAFMYNGKFHEIQDGVSNMVNAVLNMLP